MTAPKSSHLQDGTTGAVFGIIGCGIAGVIQAIHLATEFPSLQIMIFEKKHDILTGTSNMNPGRSGLGFHYQHLDTATFCQDNTVKFTKFLERIGCRDIFAEAPQRGIYVLMKDAMQTLGEKVEPVFPADEIVPVFEQIKAHAIANYTNDETYARHYGSPHEIYRELPRSEYMRFITPELQKSAGGCFETAEKTYNIPAICSFLRNYVKKLGNLTVVTRANVTRLERLDPSQGMCDSGYRITWHNGHSGTEQSHVAQLLTLACWEHVGLFRKQLGKAGRQPTHNRLKMLAVFEMDAATDGSLHHTTRPIFVASGPFCMISPQERIRGPDARDIYRCACTLAIRTNVKTAPDDQPLPLEYARMLDDAIGFDEKLGMGQQILDGARQYFTCLENARLVNVKFGTVRVPFGAGTRIDLHHAGSEHHGRHHCGYEELGDGLSVNEAMKFIYGVHNAELSVEGARLAIERLQRENLAFFGHESNGKSRSL